MYTLKRLFVIASELDEYGMTKEADIVTGIMQRIAQNTPEEIVNMAPSPHLIGQYDENAWKQAFADKYKKFLRIVEMVKNSENKNVNPQSAQGLYDEMMYIASNYLKDDTEVFNIMKWAAPTYKGMFENAVQ